MKTAANPTVAISHASNPVVSTGVANHCKNDRNQDQEQSDEIIVEPKNQPSAPIAHTVAASNINIDRLRGSATEQQQDTIKTSPMVATEKAKIINTEEKPKSSIASTFFSLMSGDSDEESDEEPLAAKVQNEAVNKSNTTAFLRYSSDDILKLKPNAAKGVLPSDSIVKRTSNKGKTSIAAAVGQAARHLVHAKQDMKSTESSFLSKQPQVAVYQQSTGKVGMSGVSSETKPRPVVKLPLTAGAEKSPQMPNIASIPNGSSSEPTEIENASRKARQTQNETDECTVPRREHQGKTETSSESVENTNLRPEAPGLVSTAAPELTSIIQNGLGKPVKAHSVAENPVRSTCLAGQIIIVTPIQIADGQLISGPPSSQLVMQSTTPANNPVPIMNIQTSEPFAANLPSRGVGRDSSGSTAHSSTPRKPTKGLGSSMWAK